MKTTQDQVQKIVFTLLDKLYSKAVKVSKHYGYKQIHISVIKEFAKVSKLDESLNIPQDFIVAFNKTLDSLVKTCMKNVVGEQIQKALFKSYIKLIKSAFIEGRNTK